jgi:PncC family amidohydrolase
VKVRITAKAASPEAAEALAAPVSDEVARRLGDTVFTRDDEELEAAVVRLARAVGRTLACAESLTGGGVGARLTGVPGASEVFLGSAVVYAVEAKRTLLGVDASILEDPGPVSEACARAMAAGARRAFGADVAVALTGAAGPDAHAGAAPGTIWTALDAGEVTHARGLRVTGDRDQVRRWAEQAGLDLLRRHLEGRPLPESDRLL